MNPTLQIRLHDDAAVVCPSCAALVALRIILISVMIAGVAHLTAPRAWAQSGLVAAYSFDEGSGNSAKDSSSAGNNGTLDDATWTASGRYGAALAFNGSSATVNIASSRSLRLTTAMTLEAWVRPAKVSTGWSDVIYKGNDNYYLMSASDNSSRPAAGGKFGPGKSSNVFGPSALAADTWTHLAATYDGTTLKLYINGALASSGARSGSIATSGNPLQIGGDGTFGQYFAGIIDEVRVYNTALTESQVRADMNTPIGSSSPAPTPTPSADLTLTKTHVGSFTQGQNGAAYTLTVKNSGSSATTGTVSLRDSLPNGLTAAGMTGSGWTCATSTLTCTRSDALAAGGSYPPVTVTVNVSSSAPSSVTNTATVSGGGESNTGNGSASDVTAIASIVSPAPGPIGGKGLVAAYSFDEGSGITVQDVSDANNDGTIKNATWTTSGRYGGALTFNGTNAVVNVPDSSSVRLTSAMTLEAWVRPAAVSSRWSDVIYKGDDNYYLMGTSDNSSRPAAGGKFASTTSSNVFGPSALAANTWTHLAATYDGSTVKLYVNGALASSGARSGSMATSSNPLQIGGDNIFGQYFAGIIDEVRVYDVALTATQIQSDMNTAIGSPSAVAPLPNTNADTLAPTVALSSPVGGAQVSATVTVTASASDNVGVTSVTFLVDGTAIGSDTAAPYSISWNTAAVAAGAHSLQAQARDAAGNVGTSPTVNVSVVAAANAPPSITILSPVDGTIMQAPATITLTATVTDADGSVSRVNFYADNTLVGSRTAAPFSVNWTAGAAGTYSFVVSATDDKGATATSAPVTVTVENAGSGTAMFTASSDDASVVRYVLEIFADGANVNTAAAAASQDLGKPPVVNGEYAADISATLASLSPGIYIATVTAEAAGGKARSAASPPFTIANGSLMSARLPDIVTASAMSRSATAAPGVGSVGTLWVTSASTHMVTAFDATTGDVLATIPVGASPVAVSAPNGSGKVYVADEESDTVSVIDTATMARVAVISLPAPFGRKPHRLAESADGSRLFVSERGSNVVDVISASSDQVVTRFAAGQPGSTILAAIPDASGQVLYALSRADDPSQNALVAIDPTTGRWMWSMPISEQVGDLTLEPDGRTALVSVPAKNAILFIDLERRVSLGAVDLGAGNAPGALRSSADGHVLITMQASHERIGIVDPAANVRVVPLAEMPSVSSERWDARLVSYITMGDGSGVVGVDAASGGVVRRFRLPGGGTASDVTFDPK